MRLLIGILSLVINLIILILIKHFFGFQGAVIFGMSLIVTLICLDSINDKD